MRTVLITGASGAIGSVLVRYLLEERETNVRLLLRAQSDQHLAERLTELHRFWDLDPHDRHLEGRIEAVSGDVSRPALGLERQTYQRLASEVTHVVHSAGNVKLNRPLDEARRAAVDSVSHIVAFADACSDAGAFEKLEYLSTVGVAGRMPGVVPERAFSEERQFRNTYEAAKAEAEAFLLRKIADGLPATIHRPSMVVGDSRTGRIIRYQVFYHLCEFLSGCRTSGIVPDAGEVRLDIIPVDYVAKAIQLSSRTAATTGRIFHLCAGPSRAPRINDLADRVREIFRAHGRAVPHARRVSPALMRGLVSVAGVLVLGRLRRAIQSLPYFLDYLDEPQVFANSLSADVFSKAGLERPVVDEFLDVVLSHYLAGQARSSSGRSSRAVA